MRQFFARLRQLALPLATALAVVLALFAGAGLWMIHTPARHERSPLPIDNHVYLDQGWDQDARETYYYTPQGTSLKNLRYEWLVHLEMPWGEARFADPEHMRAYGFIVEPQPTQMNPDQLPVGFARRFDPQLGEAVLDITCAACHTGQLFVEGSRRTALRVDGGAASQALTVATPGHFLPTLTASITSTYLNPLKFRRFGKKVLGEDGYEDGKDRLHEDMGTVLVALLRQAWNDWSKDLYPIKEGFGRTDALARIGNTVFAVDELDGANDREGTAPVSYPYVWNIWKFDWVQYNASVSQPLARNIGEAFGVGARVSMLDRYGRPLPRKEHFITSVMIENLNRIESNLQSLGPPPWREELLGVIDQDKVKKGHDLFEMHCKHCHGPFDHSETMRQYLSPLRTGSDPLWKMTIVPIEEVGTDPTAALNFVYRLVDLTKIGLGYEEAVDPIRQALKEAKDRLDRLDKHVDLATAGSDSAAPAPAQTPKKELEQERKNIADTETLLANLNMREVPLGVALSVIGAITRDRFYADRHFTDDQQACLDGFGSLDLPEIVAAYKARPLAGVWATGPFLHNGSVPTLYQLLSPQDERDAGFFVRPFSFDPVAVGLDLKAGGDGFWFDTRLPGNSNVGHEFRAGYVPRKADSHALCEVPGQMDCEDPQYGVIGPALSEEDRWAIIEYLKTLDEEQLTPPGRKAPDCFASNNDGETHD